MSSPLPSPSSLPVVAGRDFSRTFLPPGEPPVHADVYTFIPFGARVVVVRESPAKVSKGGIIIPDSAQSTATTGWLFALGPDAAEHLPLMGTHVGTKVLFGAYAGQPLLVGDKDEEMFTSRYTLLHASDLWGSLVEK